MGTNSSTDSVSISIDCQMVKERGRLTFAHFEPDRFVAAPPAAQSLSKTIVTCVLFDFAVFFVHKESGDGAGAGIYIFVVAPGSEVDVPVMELHVDVSNCMSQVPANFDAMRMSMGSNCFDVKVLSSVVLYPRQ